MRGYTVFCFAEYMSGNYMGYDMTTNPSYGSTAHTTPGLTGGNTGAFTKSYLPNSVSFSNPAYEGLGGLGRGGGGGGGGSSYISQYNYRTKPSGVGTGGGEGGRSHYSDTGAMSTSRKYGNSEWLTDSLCFLSLPSSFKLSHPPLVFQDIVTCSFLRSWQCTCAELESS